MANTYLQRTNQTADWIQNFSISIWFKKSNKTVRDSNLKPSLGFIKNEQGFTSIGKVIIALLVLAVLSYPVYKVYDKFELNNLT